MSKVNGKPAPFPVPDASLATGFDYPFRRPHAVTDITPVPVAPVGATQDPAVSTEPAVKP